MLKGFALFDRLERPLERNEDLVEQMWERREIENYLCMPAVLKLYATVDLADDLFGRAEAGQRGQLMDEIVRRLIPPVALEDRDDP